MHEKRVVKIELDYNQVMTNEQVEMLEKASGNTIKTEPVLDKPELRMVDCLSREHLVSLEEIQAIKIPFRILEVTSFYRKPEEFQVRGTPAPVNEKCNVIVAGVSMLHIDEVIVVTNCCTESLQTELNQGWRILAICVQPDQRRPDYVLGRSSKGVQP